MHFLKCISDKHSYNLIPGLCHVKPSAQPTPQWSSGKPYRERMAAGSLTDEEYHPGNIQMSEEDHRGGRSNAVKPKYRKFTAT